MSRTSILRRLSLAAIMLGAVATHAQAEEGQEAYVRGEGHHAGHVHEAPAEGEHQGSASAEPGSRGYFGVGERSDNEAASRRAAEERDRQEFLQKVWTAG